MPARRSTNGPGRPDAGGTAGQWWTLVAVCGATFMLLVDITIVQVALPTVQRTLHASFNDLQWVIDAYSISLAALILTQGTLADRFGRKRLFVFGLVVFTLASLACGLSRSPLDLVVARAVQGIGGAAMFATSLALIAQDYQGKQRSAAIAAWGATVGGAVAIGPLVGGALTSGLGWQWIFYVNVPVGLATLGLSTRITNVRDPHATRLDWGGLLTLSGSLTLLVLGLTRGNDDGWGTPRILALFAASAVLLAVFVAVELRHVRPMFDLSLFRKPSFTGVSVATFGIGAGMFALLTYLTLYLQNDLGLSPYQSGLRLLPLTLMAFFVPLVSHPVTDRVPPGMALTVGLAVCGGGLLMFRGLTDTSTWTALLPGFVVCGVGMGLANPAIAKIALGVVPPQRSGMASGISNTFRVAGVATGVAALGAVFQGRLAAGLQGAAGHVAPALSRQVAAAGIHGVIEATRGNGTVVAAARVSFASSMDVLFMVGAVAVFVGAGFAVMVRRKDFWSRRRAARAVEQPAPQRELVVETA